MTPPHNSAIWVSELNARPEIRSAFPRSAVRFYDTTLRDGEQTVGVVLSPQQKLEIARQLDGLGVSRIEAGFPRVSADDAEAIQLMLKAGLRAELWGFSRAVQADVEELVRLGLRASVIEAPTSDIKLHAYGISRDEVLTRVHNAVSFAKRSAIRVAFFAVDGTRTDPEFLKKVYLAALEAGAAEIVVVDTIGACGPEAVEYLIGHVRQWIGSGIPIPVLSPLSEPVPPGSKGPSTAWGSAQATRTSAKSLSPSAVFTTFPSPLTLPRFAGSLNLFSAPAVTRSNLGSPPSAKTSSCAKAAPSPANFTSPRPSSHFLPTWSAHGDKLF